MCAERGGAAGKEVLSARLGAHVQSGGNLISGSASTPPPPRRLPPKIRKSVNRKPRMFARQGATSAAPVPSARRPRPSGPSPRTASLLLLHMARLLLGSCLGLGLLALGFAWWHAKLHIVGRVHHSAALLAAGALVPTGHALVLGRRCLFWAASFARGRAHRSTRSPRRQRCALAHPFSRSWRMRYFVPVSG